jgi:hypothetical protein
MITLNEIGFWKIRVIIVFNLTLCIMIAIAVNVLAEIPDFYPFEKVLIEIVNHDQLLQYRIISPTLEPVTISTHARKAGPDDPLAETIKTLKLTQASRREAAKGFKVKFERPVMWANLSPDKNYVLFGLDDPAYQTMHQVVLMRVSDRQVISDFGYIAGSYICDSMWSSDSKMILILGSSEYVKKNPWGILAALSGHPIQMHTFFVDVINPVSALDSRRIKIVEDIENATAHFKEGNEFGDKK